MFGLSFLYPLFLAGAVAIAIPIALHLFRRRTETVVDFPAVRLLHKAPVEQQRRRKIREWILLALRVTALALLAFAFARPYLRSATPALASPITIVALDTSMSLSAPGQFDAARDAARKAVSDAPATMLVGLVTFSDSATVAVPPTADRGGVIAAITAANAGPGGTRYRTALARAAEALGGSQGKIVVVSDLQQAGWETADEGAVPEGVDIEIVEVRPPETNIAVTAIRREGQAVVAAVHNFGTRPARVAAQLSLDGRVTGSERIDIAPQSAAEARFVVALPPRGGIEVTIEDATGYQADNTRYLVLDPGAAVPIIVLTADSPASSREGLYIERALGVAGDGTGRDLLASYVKNGGRVLLTLGPGIDFDTLNDSIGADLGVARDPASQSGTVTLVAVDARHPIFRPFSNPSGALGDVYVEQYRRLNDQKERTVLARFSGGVPALVEQPVERGRLLVFASDLDNQWNRFPLNPAFVPFAVESMKYLTQGREQRQLWMLPETPPGVSPVPGIHSLPPATPGTPERQLAINVDIRESNPVRTTRDAFLAGITRLSQSAEVKAASEAKDQEERQRLWQLGLMAMLLALVGEGLIGRKAI
jgi:hypothetical protein